MRKHGQKRRVWVWPSKRRLECISHRNRSWQLFSQTMEKWLNSIQSSSELPLPSQAQSGRVKGQSGFKGGLTSACGTMVMLPGTASYPRLCSTYASPLVFCLLMYDSGRPEYSTDLHSHCSREHRQQILVVFHGAISIGTWIIWAMWSWLPLLRFQRMGPHKATDLRLQPKKTIGHMLRATPGPSCWAWRAEHQVKGITYEPYDLLEFALWFELAWDPLTLSSFLYFLFAMEMSTLCVCSTIAFERT